jgi:hypothetical protein
VYNKIQKNTKKLLARLGEKLKTGQRVPWAIFRDILGPTGTFYTPGGILVI